MDAKQVGRIDTASMDILEYVGVQFRDPVALQHWKDTGAKVSGERIHAGRDLIATFPSDINYAARNPANNLRLGGRNAIFFPMTGAPYMCGVSMINGDPHAG